MKSENRDKFTILTPDLSESVESQLHAAKKGAELTNWVIDLSGLSNFAPSLRSLLQTMAQDWSENNKSLVVVVQMTLLEELDGIIIAVPTVSEAADYVYMDELEREL